jgi:hypothetical protein
MTAGVSDTVHFVERVGEVRDARDGGNHVASKSASQ